MPFVKPEEFNPLKPTAGGEANVTRPAGIVSNTPDPLFAQGQQQPGKLPVFASKSVQPAVVIPAKKDRT